MAYAWGKMKMGSFFLYLIVIIGLQWVIQLICEWAGIPYQIAMFIVDFVLAFVFAWVNFRREREWYKDPRFHKTFVGYFLILLLFDMLLWMI